MKTVTYDQVAETNSPLFGNVLLGEHALYRSMDNRVTYDRVGTHHPALHKLVVLTEDHVAQLSAATSTRQAYEIWTTAIGTGSDTADWFWPLELIRRPFFWPMDAFDMWENDFRSGKLKMWGRLLKDLYDARPKSSLEGLTYDEYRNCMIMYRALILSPDAVARGTGLANEAFGWNIPHQFHLLLFATLALTLLAFGTEVAED